VRIARDGGFSVVAMVAFQVHIRSGASQTTKHPELRFRALLADDVSELELALI
jgi:hypothetical protein